MPPQSSAGRRPLTPDGVPASIQAELTRLKPGRIVVLGGSSAVSDSVLATLKGLAAGTVTRLAGADRYETSAAISAASFAPGAAVVYIGSGANFPDALSGAPIAGMGAAPLLLVRTDAIPASVQAELARLKPAKIVVLGGASAVSDTVARQLQTYLAK